MPSKINITLSEETRNELKQSRQKPKELETRLREELQSVLTEFEVPNYLIEVTITENAKKAKVPKTRSVNG